MREQQHSDLELMLKGYGLTTAQFLYHLPDYPRLLQTFVWQFLDLSPDYPELFHFIDFWKVELDGRLHSVQFTHQQLISPGERRQVHHEYKLP